MEQCKLPFTSSNLAEREIGQNRSEFATEQVTTESSEGRKNTSGEKKHPCFTFKGRALKLPTTPKRQKRKKWKAPRMNNVKNARRGNTNGGEKARESSIIEVIMIDGNSEDEPQLKITAKDTVAY